MMRDASDFNAGPDVLYEMFINGWLCLLLSFLPFDDRNVGRILGVLKRHFLSLDGSLIL